MMIVGKWAHYPIPSFCIGRAKAISSQLLFPRWRDCAYDSVMFNRQNLVDKLISTLHLDVCERISFEEMPLRTDEVVSAISAALRSCGYFPSDARPWTKGHGVFEGYFLELLPNAAVRLWLQRHYPTDSYQLAEQQRRDYVDLSSAVESFVAKEWKGQIDGIAIIDE